MLFIILLILVFCFVLLVWTYFTNNRNYWKKKNILQVKDLLWTFTFENCSIPEICKNIYDKHNVSHIGTSMGTTRALIIKNVEDIQAVLAGDFKNFYRRGIKFNPDDVLADNLLFTDDFHKWKLIRQRLSPVFTSAMIKNKFYILERCARDFVDRVIIHQDMNRKPFKILYTYTTASIAASVFGIDTQTKNTMDSPFLHMAWKSLKPTMKRNITTLTASIFPKLFQLLKLKLFDEHEDFFINAVKSVLESRRHATKKRHDFIDTCLELQKNGVMQDNLTGYKLYPTDKVIAAEAFFFFIAGADTTANAIHFTLLELSSNPKILGKLHDEIDSIFETGKENLTYQDVEKLQYLDMIINEALRKYPPIGFIQRVCTKDTVLPSNVKIEKDVAVVIPVFAIHRDEKHYPNPHIFNPERFRASNASNVSKFSYLGFGGGNRICLGARFARLQIKIGLAWLLRHFTLSQQQYIPKRFERSTFALRDTEASYQFIKRDI